MMDRASAQHAARITAASSFAGPIPVYRWPRAGVARSREIMTSSPPSAARVSLVVGLGVLVWLLPHPPELDPRAWRLLAIFVATVTGIIVKPLPMSATAMAGIAAIVATPTPTGSEALSGFSNTNGWRLDA